MIVGDFMVATVATRDRRCIMIVGVFIALLPLHCSDDDLIKS